MLPANYKLAVHIVKKCLTSSKGNVPAIGPNIQPALRRLLGNFVWKEEVRDLQRSRSKEAHLRLNVSRYVAKKIRHDALIMIILVALRRKSFRELLRATTTSLFLW